MLKVNVRLDEDDILSDILGELDSKKESSARLPTSTRNLSKEKEEKELVKQYMQSFTKPATKTKDEDDVSALESLLRFKINIFLTSRTS